MNMGEKQKENENLMTVQAAEIVQNDDSNKFKITSRAAIMQVIC